MTWLPLLLGDSSSALRYLILKELLSRDDNDEEVQELKKLRLDDPLITSINDAQNNDGSWDSSELLGLQLDSLLRNTAQTMYRLGYLGFNKEYPAIKKAANYLFSQQLENGAWSRSDNKNYSFKHTSHGEVISPMQTAFPLRALAMCGYATDSRAEKAYEWLLNHRAEDGSWPPFISPDGKVGYQPVGYRQMPNSRFGCRSNSTSVLCAFAYHPKRRNSDEAKRALDLLLARETQDRQYLGLEVARIIGIEPSHGYLTYFGRFDLSLILNLCWRIGASKEDVRVTKIVKYLQEIQSTYGLWEYQPNPQATRWISFDILRSLSKLDETGDWISTEPRTKYKSYPRKPRRF
ncbi:MAG: terpene cyclase/mutase family protein [Asgard group archaeon]|nr:terpene cyclase/mutase family protein [Asgard group archaeon]